MEAIIIGIIALVISQVFRNMKQTKQNRPGQMPPPGGAQPAMQRRDTPIPPVVSTNSPNDMARQIMQAFGRKFAGEEDEREKTGQADYADRSWRGSLVGTDYEEEPWRGSLSGVSGEGMCYDSLHEPLHARGRTYERSASITTAAVVHRESRGQAVRNSQIGMASIQGMRMDAQHMRAAVIMAEIIGPPKSRRKMNTGRSL